MLGMCHECLKEFNTSSALLIPNTTSPIWECPYCDYPNSASDLGIIPSDIELGDKS